VWCWCSCINVVCEHQDAKSVHKCVWVGVPSQQLCIVHCALCGLLCYVSFFLAINVLPEGFVLCEQTGGEPAAWRWPTLLHPRRVCVAEVVPEHTVDKYLGCSPCRSSGHIENITCSDSVFRSWSSSRKWTAPWANPFFLLHFVFLSSSCAEVQLLRWESVRWWSRAGGKTSSTQPPAVPLACSSCVLNGGQTTACDSLPCVTWEVSE